MSVDLLSVLALLGVLLLGSVRTDLNVGVVATALAFIIGLGFAGLEVQEVSALLPSGLLLTIVGVSLLFQLASSNGTLERLTARLIASTRGSPRRLPLAFFALTFALSALGPGNIAATALVAPLAMRLAVGAGINPVLMAILVCTGANAGAFSPVSVTGSINAALMSKVGLTDPNLPLLVFAAVGALQSITALIASLIFSGNLSPRPATPQLELPRAPPFEARHRWTLLIMVSFLLAVIVWRTPTSAAAFTLAGVMLLFRLSEDAHAVQNLPWPVIVLISGISVLVGLLEQTGGLALVTAWLARVATPGTLNALLAFTSGLASAGSSSSGVVMPLFIPLAPDIIRQLGSGNLLEAVIAIDAGSHLVDVSPLSTLGALCLAAMPEGKARERLFRSLLLWGFAMAFVGGLLAFLFLDLRWVG
jgi:Na+/H+ antiporter NhaD/arsenite permease-like protein